MKRFAISLALASLMLVTGCVTTQTLVENQARLDHPCKAEDMYVGPIEAPAGGWRWEGSVFAAVCKEKGNEWRAKYVCESKVLGPLRCTKVDVKK